MVVLLYTKVNNVVVKEYNVCCMCSGGLKGQHISAQGNTLGNGNWQNFNTPYRGKRTPLHRGERIHLLITVVGCNLYNITTYSKTYKLKN